MRRRLVSLFLVGKIIVPPISGEKESCFSVPGGQDHCSPFFLVRRSLVSLLFLVGKIIVPPISGEKESCYSVPGGQDYCSPYFW